MADEQYCKQIYMNGKPFLLYDTQARNDISELTSRVNNLSISSADYGSRLSTVNQNGEYRGPLKYVIPSKENPNEFVDTEGIKVTDSYTSVAGSGIPYFVYEQLNAEKADNYRLIIKFR